MDQKSEGGNFHADWPKDPAVLAERDKRLAQFTEWVGGSTIEFMGYCLALGELDKRRKEKAPKKAKKSNAKDP